MTRPTEIFARRMREERQRAGLSQADVGERLTEVLGRTVDHSAIARAEKHQRAIRLDEAIAIAELLELPMSALLRDRDQVDDEIGELERDLSMADWRAAQAQETLQQSRDEVAGIRRRIAELEATRGD